MLERLMDSLLQSSWGRLKWMVLREFGVLPQSRLAKKMRDSDYIACALYMLADARQKSAPRLEENPAFDANRFDELRKEAVKFEF